MDILTAIQTCFRKSFVFSGRASRPEFWYWILFFFIGFFVLNVLDSIIFNTRVFGITESPISDLFSWIVLPASLAVGWRRLHDIGRSGWWIGSGFLWLVFTLCLALGLAFVVHGAVDSGNTALINKFEPFAPAIKALGFVCKWFNIPWGIILFVFFCMPSLKRDNRYGAAPKHSKELVPRENSSKPLIEYRPQSTHISIPYSS